MARTQAAVEHGDQFITSLARRTLALTSNEHNGKVLNPQKLAQLRVKVTNGPIQSLIDATKLMPAVLDLAVKFVLTDRTPGFIIADHPVVASNQFAEHHRKFSGYPNITGLLVKGLQLFMPLSPSVSVMAFDPAVYEVDGHGTTCRAGPREVRFLNSMQIVNALKCVYFHSARTPESALRHLLEVRASHQPIHMSDTCVTKLVEPEERTLVVTTRRDIRVGARFGFLRVTDRAPYEGYNGAFLPVRSLELLELTRKYSEFIERKIATRFAQKKGDVTP